MGISLRELGEEWMKDPEFKKGYDALEPQFAMADALIGARVHSGLSQAQIARRMHTSQSTVARLEGGRANPSMATLEKFAKATGCTLSITFTPKAKEASHGRLRKAG